jgi:uncharacterized membrane protein HdeD (DUF308 family)
MAASISANNPGNISEVVRGKWGWFLALGIVLIIAGSFAIMMPFVSTVAASLVIGISLAASGVVQIIHAFQTRAWRGFFWHVLVGLIELVGGVLIWLNPFAGAFVITAVIGSVFLLQGLAQISLAFQVRPHDGWGWLLFSGIITVLASIWLFLRLPIIGLFAPGLIVGISLLFEGWAFVALAFAAKRSSARKTA